METFLTVVLVIVVGFWLLGKLLRFALGSWLLRRQREFAERMGGNFGGFGGGQRTQRSTRAEGEVKVEKTTEPEQPLVNKQVGEYVEFEEEK